MSGLTLDMTTLEILKGIKCACPAIDRRLFNHYPIFDHNDNGSRIYYAPWFVNRDGLLPQQVKALEVLDAAIKKLSIIEVQLAKGHALYVDNGRVLHGRGAVESDSKRHLVRHWIGVTS